MGTGASAGNGTGGTGQGSGSGGGSGPGDGEGDAAADSNPGSPDDAGGDGSAGEFTEQFTAKDSESDAEFAARQQRSIADTFQEQPKTKPKQGPAKQGAGRAGGGQGGDGSIYDFGNTGGNIIYVVDCSGSMLSGAGGRGDSQQMSRFGLACRELARSIGRLEPQQKFFVFFYDTNSFPMFGERQSTMRRATTMNKSDARRWVMEEFKPPGGGTNPSQSLRDALQMKPDVIYFLTDGAIPGNVPALIRRENTDGETVVNTICFRDRSGERVLQQIARENRGEYRFVR